MASVTRIRPAHINDGRKVNNGDCALFRAGDAPPFIGKISYQIVDEEGNVKLGVNWLYRPADVKLGQIGGEEGLLLPPNEIFYSFQKDEISGTSLLHPCKVAFLGKDVELPSGVSSFVCRRVYDVTTRCLWWLTDRDYSNEHQEEVDELLNKTRREMQATMQSGGLSPRTVNAAAQLKATSDNIQNGLFEKSKKRERVDQNNEPPKRGRFSRPDNSNSGHVKQEYNVRPEEIINITDKDGRLTNLADVDHLVHLMRQNRKDSMKKGRDLVLHRTMLVGVIATTDQEDCLGQFVRSGGLSILDDWLQEAHKGKSGDSGSPKEGEKAHEDLLLVLLQALGKLPVDIEALQTCNVGKSVKHLRNHKDSDIQKKARILVDIWKRRVEEEMKNNDTGSGSAHGVSLPCKQGLGDVSEHGNKSIESSEITSESLASLTPSSKADSSRLVQEDSGKGPSAFSLKDSHCKIPVFSTTDLSVTMIKEEKISSSSQSQNDTRTCPSNHAKAGSSVWKEDVRIPGAGSTSSKVSQSTSLHKSPNKGVTDSVQSGNHKECAGANSLLLSRNTTVEKDTQTISEKVGDNTWEDSGQRLIVRLPNLSCHRAQCLNFGSNTDKIVPESRGLSSCKSGKHEGKAKTETNALITHPYLQVDTVSLKSNGSKISSADCSCDNSDDAGKVVEISNTSQILSSGPGEKEGRTEEVVEAISRKLCESAGTTKDVAEGCSKYSEATAVSMNEHGVNLLGSVIVTEISKAEDGYDVKTGTNLLMTKEGNLGQDTKPRCHSKASSTELTNEDFHIALDLKKEKNDCESMDEDQKVNCTAHKQDSYDSEPGFVAETGEGRKRSLNNMILETSIKNVACEDGNAGNKLKNCMPSNQGAENSREMFCSVVEKLETTEEGGLASVYTEKETKDEPERHDMHKIGEFNNSGDTEHHVQDVTADVKQTDDHCLEHDKEEIESGNRGKLTEGYIDPRASDCDVYELKVDNLVIVEDNLFRSTCQDLKEAGKNVVYEANTHCSKPLKKDPQDVSSLDEQAKNIGVFDVEELHCICVGDYPDKGKDKHADGKQLPDPRDRNEAEQTVGCGEVQEVNRECSESGIGCKKNVNMEMGSDTVLDFCDDENKVGIKVYDFSKVSSYIGRTEEQNSAILSSTSVHQEGNSVISAPKSACSNELYSEQIMITEVFASKNDGFSMKDKQSGDTVERPDFDLNEGIDLDEAVQHDATIALSVIHCANASVSFTASSSGLATPIAVVAASKGPFVPPIGPVRSIGELGWRGSAATSAFRPAEPRKFSEQHPSLSELGNVDAALNNICEKRSGTLLDIDLNVADERVLEEEATLMNLSSEQCASLTSFPHRDAIGDVFTAPTNKSNASYGLSCSPLNSALDLNSVYQSVENGSINLPLDKKAENFGSTLKTATNGLAPVVSSVVRDFDLNDGPLEEREDDLLPHNSSGKGPYVSYPTSNTGLRMNGEVVNSSSWISPMNAVQAVAMPFCPSAKAVHPAVAAAAFPNTTGASYSFGGFPFGSTFPLTSASFSGRTLPYSGTLGSGSFPAIPSPIDTAGMLSSSYMRPFMMNPIEASCAESSGTWSKSNLDLNMGPAIGDMDFREERLFGRQTTMNGPVSLEHTAALQPSAPGGHLKKKEYEGWNLHMSGCKEPWR